jgi:ATP-binding cassette subfamily F protein uup
MDGSGSVYEHVGTYSELLEKLKDKPQKTIKMPTKSPAQTREKTHSVKLSFSEKYQLENLPKEIAKLEEENKAIEIALGNANLYTDDPQKFDELTSKLAQNKQALEEKENRWLELQLKAEAMES